MLGRCFQSIMGTEGAIAIVAKSEGSQSQNPSTSVPEAAVAVPPAKDSERELSSPASPGERAVFLGLVAEEIVRVSKQGFTTLFVAPRPFTPEESEALRESAWNDIAYEDVLTDSKYIVAFLRNPHTQDECFVDRFGYATLIPASELRNRGLLPPFGRGPSHSALGVWLKQAGKDSRVLEPHFTPLPGLPLDWGLPSSVEQAATIRPLETTPSQANVPAHVTVGAALVQDKSIITRGGDRYLPLPLAAWTAQASESALRNWIDHRVKFGGRSLRTHISLTKGVYVSEESVQRIASRFVNWPSNEPAGPVTLGETDDQSGFLAMSDAARIVGVSSRTMWLWASQGKAPTDKSLDVIKCTTSDHFYIREKDVFELNALVPRSGLQRGRRPKVSVEP